MSNTKRLLRSVGYGIVTLLALAAACGLWIAILGFCAKHFHNGDVWAMGSTIALVVLVLSSIGRYEVLKRRER